MRTILKVLLHVALITWFILHFTCPQITHKYIGTVCSPITFEKELCINSGNKTKYIFEYKDKAGNIRDSKDIRESARCYGFITKSGTWVEKQLLKKGKVYIPGWRGGMIFEFIICCFIFLFFEFCFICGIGCRFYDYDTFDSCKKCGCPLCVFEKETIKKDESFFKRINLFFGYEQ